MLFDAYQLGPIHLSNRIVMAPLTRSRAVDRNIPNALMAEYYGQRATAGLIITEGTSPSPNGLGYARIPGLFNAAQAAGWKAVTESVHAKGGKIFVQLMHTGRVTHKVNLPTGARVVGPSADVCPGEMWTDASGMQPHSAPSPMTAADIAEAVGEFAHAAKLAVEAGFDGVEIHAANGYLIEQFMNPHVNKRTDNYGGSAENRNRFALDVVNATITAIGAARVGIRVSPFGTFNGTDAFDGVEAQYLSLAETLGKLSLAYLHLVDHSSMGAPVVPAAFKTDLQKAFGRTFIASGGFDGKTAKEAVQQKCGDLVAFGRPILANPDLVARLKSGAELNAPDPSTFYTPGPKGYTDYPSLAA